MPKTIELLPKTFNYTIGINNIEKNIIQNINKNNNFSEVNKILIENEEIKGNISISK
tara:strand:- start:209 stop:379 length:171 start_codon:yes stop_codon:yes gene_type:complete